MVALSSTLSGFGGWEAPEQINLDTQRDTPQVTLRHRSFLADVPHTEKTLDHGGTIYLCHLTDLIQPCKERGMDFRTVSTGRGRSEHPQNGWVTIANDGFKVTSFSGDEDWGRLDDKGRSYCYIIFPMSKRRRLNPMSWGDILQTEYKTEWLVPGFIAEGMPGIIGGPYKCCKTLTTLDLCLSVAYEKQFLNRFQANQGNTMLFTGESALPILKEKGLLMMAAKGIPKGDDKFHIEDIVPRIDGPLEELEGYLRDYGTKLLIIDPVFKAMGGGEMNVGFSVYEKLSPLTDLCQEIGCTLLFCHHATKKSGKTFERLDLADLQWSGFAEWTRQTLLLSRRAEYRKDGRHPLYLGVHNNANQGGDYHLDIDEGDPQGGRELRWDVRVRDQREVAIEEGDTLFELMLESIESMEKEQFTKSDLADQLGKSRNTIGSTIDSLLEKGAIEIVGPVKARGQKYQLTNKE